MKKTTYVTVNGSDIAVEKLPEDIQIELEVLDKMKSELDEIKYKSDVLFCAIKYKSNQIANSLKQKFTTKPDTDVEKTNND